MPGFRCRVGTAGFGTKDDPGNHTLPLALSAHGGGAGEFEPCDRCSLLLVVDFLFPASGELVGLELSPPLS